MATDPPDLHKMLKGANRLYRRTQDEMTAVRELRASSAILASRLGMPLAEIGKDLDLSAQRVQQIIDSHWNFRVTFEGRLTPAVEVALGEAGLVFRISRGYSTGPEGWREPTLNHTILLRADDAHDALQRVEGALKGDAGLFGFEAHPIARDD